MLFDYNAAEAYMYTKYTDSRMDFDDVRRWVDRFIEHDDFRTATNVVWDATAVDTIALDFSDMQAFGTYVGERRDKRGAGRSAFVTDNDLLFGLFRTHEMMNPSKFDYEFRVFRKLDDAVGWATGRNA